MANKSQAAREMFSRREGIPCAAPDAARQRKAIANIFRISDLMCGLVCFVKTCKAHPCIMFYFIYKQ